MGIILTKRGSAGVQMAVNQYGITSPKRFAPGMKRGRSYARSPISVMVPPICMVPSIKKTGTRQKPSGISTASARPSGGYVTAPTTLAHQTSFAPDTLTITNIHSQFSHPIPSNPLVSFLPYSFIPSSPQLFRLPSPVPAMVSPPFPVSTYVNQYRHRFDALRFDAIPEQRDQSGGNVEDRATAWASRWRHVPCGVEIPNIAPWDLQWLRCEGEREFLSNLATIWSRFTAADLVLPDGAVRRHLCPWPQPFHRMYWLERSRWGEDAQRDARLRNHPGTASARVQLMSGWHNTEYHSMPFRSRANLYGRKPTWWESFEPHPHLCIPTPVTFAYIGSELNTNDRGRRVVVLAIGFTEQVVNCFWGWVDACRYGLHNFAHRNTASGFLVPEDQTDFRGRMFRLSPALVNKFYELGLDWLLSGSGITPQVGDQALHRMRWYFRRHPNTVWVAYDWQQDRFPEERIPQQVYPEVVQGGSEWGDPMDSVVPYEDSRTKRRRTDDGWATALTVARSTPASPRNLSLIPVTGGHPAGLNTTAPPVQSRRAVPVGVRRASTGGTVPQPPLRLRHIPPRVAPSPSPVVAPSEQRAKSPEGLPRPDMANEDVIRPNVPTTPRVAPSSGREPSADDAVTPQLATPGVPDVVELPLKEFQAYQEACREQGVEIPGTVSEALTTASGLLRKDALYEWLTE